MNCADGNCSCGVCDRIECKLGLLPSGNTPAQKLSSLVRRVRQAFWQQELRRTKPGTYLRITSQCFLDPEPFEEVLKYEYVDDSHIHGTTEHGISVGTSTCFVLNVEVLDEFTWGHDLRGKA